MSRRNFHSENTIKNPAVYHDLHSLQLLQFINSCLLDHDLPITLGPCIQNSYEGIASNLFKHNSKTDEFKPILLTGSARKAIIAHCIFRVCVSNNIKIDKYKIGTKMGITKKRMDDIHQKYLKSIL